MTPASQALALRRLPFGAVLPPGAFRLMLAAAVVLSHVSRIGVGRLAVLLFFLLSGYWTARIWREKFGAGSILRFYAARYLRIAPLYMLVMLAASWFRAQPPGLENFTLFGVASSHRDPTGVSWSLDIELQFYLLLPLIFALLVSTPTWASVVGVLAVSAAGLWLSERYGVVTVAKYLPAFALGALVYVKDWKPGAKTAHISLGAFILMTVATAFTPFLDKKNAAPFDHDVWGFIWMLPLLPYVAHSLTLKSSRMDRHLGNLSYPLYLVHFATIAVATQTLGNRPAVKLAAAGLAGLIALAIYVVVDRPVDRYRIRWTEGARG